MRIRKCYYKLFCIESNLHVKLYFILTTIVCLLIGLSVHELCVQSRDTPITSENRRPNLSVGAVETDGGRKKTEKEEKKNSFWKWPALHFPCSRAGTYDLAKAEEKYGIEAGTHWRDSDGTITSNTDKSLN